MIPVLCYFTNSSPCYLVVCMSIVKKTYVVMLRNCIPSVCGQDENDRKSQVKECSLFCNLKLVEF